MKTLLVITGSIAAYKALELCRLLVKQGAEVDVILTAAAQQFITPLAVSALTGRRCYTDLWSLKDETEMGHIRLTREADHILVAPASADFIAKLATGRADDLASTTLLAATQSLIIAPAMNPAMLAHPATQSNIQMLKDRGAILVYGDAGSMACGEIGDGRFAEPTQLYDLIMAQSAMRAVQIDPNSLQGKRILVTAGPTREAIDPVRYLSNHSSGKQGYALATILASCGAQVTLVSGPTSLPRPLGVTRIDVTSATEMAEAVTSLLPIDMAFCAAAVSDWQATSPAAQKQKKANEAFAPQWKETPDILHLLGHHTTRPELLVGFAAETEQVTEHAMAKCRTKKCDLIVANDVSHGKVFGEDENTVHLCTPQACEPVAIASKTHISAVIIRKCLELMS
mgnify:FL=1|tara:strand:- start:291 stop:1484 length:1194 start_codon:yes stop_codon:yes gene_type:complete